jgi:hypothetical protein
MIINIHLAHIPEKNASQAKLQQVYINKKSNRRITTKYKFEKFLMGFISYRIYISDYRQMIFDFFERFCLDFFSSMAMGNTLRFDVD